MTGILNLLAGSISSAIKDGYFNLTTLLLSGNGTNGAQNNTFLDSSSNNFTITRNGNTTQGTFTPFSQTGWGNYFSGSATSLRMAANSAFDQNAGSFSVECWVYPNTIQTTTGLYIYGAQANTALLMLAYGYTTGLFKIDQGAGSGVKITSNNTYPANAWYHVVYTYDGTTLRLFVNGVLQGSATSISPIASPTVAIGEFGGGSYFNGYVSNFRICRAAIPTAYQTSSTTVGTTVFTPSTAPLTTTSQGASNVTFLTCQNNRFADVSGSNIAITINGTPSVQAFSPFAPSGAYDPTAVGGSGYFDGTGDCLSLTYDAKLVSGGTTNAFTVDFWYYLSSSFTNSARLLSFSQDGGATGWDLWCDTSGILYMNNGGTSSPNQRSFGAGSLNTNEWAYIRLVSDGTNFSAYRNGSRIYTIAGGFATVASGNLPTIGARRNSTNTISNSALAYICDVRVVKDGALNSPSDTTITVPTAPLTSSVSTGTCNLLLNFTNAGITDATAKNVIETVGNAQISTTQSKFGGSSMYFDGTDDRLLIPSSPNLDFGSGDFTIECWAYNTAWDVDQNQLFERGRFTVGKSYRGWMKATQIVLEVNLSGTAIGTYTGLTATVTNNLNQWYHVAFVRSGSNFYIFRDGSQVATTTSSASIFTTTEALAVGGAADGNNNIMMNGYINDFRITKGFARYTANFSVTTAAFPVK